MIQQLFNTAEQSNNDVNKTENTERITTTHEPATDEAGDETNGDSSPTKADIESVKTDNTKGASETAGDVGPVDQSTNSKNIPNVTEVTEDPTAAADNVSSADALHSAVTGDAEDVRDTAEESDKVNRTAEETSKAAAEVNEVTKGETDNTNNELDVKPNETNESLTDKQADDDTTATEADIENEIADVTDSAASADSIVSTVVNEPFDTISG